jgi:hypothetical protein
VNRAGLRNLLLRHPRHSAGANVQHLHLGHDRPQPVGHLLHARLLGHVVSEDDPALGTGEGEVGSLPVHVIVDPEHDNIVARQQPDYRCRCSPRMGIGDLRAGPRPAHHRTRRERRPRRRRSVQRSRVDSFMAADDNTAARLYAVRRAFRIAIVPHDSIVSGTSRMPECQKKGSVVNTT